MKESLGTMQNEKQKSINKRSAEDAEIEILDQTRNEMLQKANRTLKEKIEYAEHNELVKEALRTRARVKRDIRGTKGPRQSINT